MMVMVSVLPICKSQYYSVEYFLITRYDRSWMAKGSLLLYQISLRYFCHKWAFSALRERTTIKIFQALCKWNLLAH